MPTLDAAHRVALDFLQVRNAADLKDLLGEVCTLLECDFFALSHHVDFLGAPSAGLRVHNYPEEWAHWFDSQRLGIDDPVHRASQRTAAGFVWRDMPKFIRLRPADERVLARARFHGIADGLTVPAHIPGEAHGSCSFAWDGRAGPDPGALVFAQSISSFAFEAARRIHRPRKTTPPRLTDRQRECVIWVARDKTDRQISQILGIRHSTVIEHLRNARSRYEVRSRARLTMHALFDGTITFAEITNR